MLTSVLEWRFILRCFYRFSLEAVNVVEEQLLPEIFGILALFQYRKLEVWGWFPYPSDTKQQFGSSLACFSAAVDVYLSWIFRSGLRSYAVNVRPLFSWRSRFCFFSSSLPSCWQGRRTNSSSPAFPIVLWMDFSLPSVCLLVMKVGAFPFLSSDAFLAHSSLGWLFFTPRYGWKTSCFSLDSCSVCTATPDANGENTEEMVV